MEILLIILIILVLFFIYQDYKTAKKPKKPKMTAEEKKKFEEAKKSFNNLMEYDYEKALKKE